MTPRVYGRYRMVWAPVMTAAVAVVVVVMACGCGASEPPRPSFPTSYHTVQLSKCLKMSMYCPTGFVNETGASQSYYDYDASKMAAQDTYDLQVTGTSYVSDQTFIDPVNATHLRTHLYYLTPGASAVACFSTVTPGVIPPPNVLAEAQLMGRVPFLGRDTFEWKTATGLWYTDAPASQGIVGMQTLDGSQVNAFMWLEAVAVAARAFAQPQGVPCPAVTAERMQQLMQQRMIPAWPVGHAMKHLL